MHVVSSPSTPYLILKAESGNRRLPLDSGNCWTIGRNQDNHLVLPDRWISRNHAILQCTEDEEFYLIDLGSRNGSFVNGRRVSVPVTLKNGDHLTFGVTEVEFYCPSSERLSNDSIDKDTSTSTLHVRRLISVMVIDIRDFTVLTRKLDETMLSMVIGSWFREAGDIIRKHGSWVDKYIGDAVMAVWFHGSGGPSQEEIIQIFRAVDELYCMTQEINQQYPLPFNLKIGAGINTGYAMVGNTGSGDRPDYTAIGDTVNAAFRLESATKEIGLDVALGETTYKYLSSLHQNDNGFAQYTVNLKGYETASLVYAASFLTLQNFLQLFAGGN